MPGPCGSHKKHQVLPGNTFCERCGKRVYKRRDKDLQTIYKAYVKQLHPHFFIAGYCIDCGLEREPSSPLDHVPKTLRYWSLWYTNMCYQMESTIIDSTITL